MEKPFLIGNNWFSQGLGAKISNLTKSSSFITFFVGQKLPWGYKVLGAIIPPSSLRAPVCRHCSRRLNAAPPPSHGCPLIRNWIPIFPLVCVCVLKAQFGSVVLVKLKAAPPPSPYHPELYAHIFIGGRIPSMPLFFKSLVCLTHLHLLSFSFCLGLLLLL